MLRKFLSSDHSSKKNDGGFFKNKNKETKETPIHTEINKNENEMSVDKLLPYLTGEDKRRVSSFENCICNNAELLDDTSPITKASFSAFQSNLIDNIDNYKINQVTHIRTSPIPMSLVAGRCSSLVASSYSPPVSHVWKTDVISTSDVTERLAGCSVSPSAMRRRSRRRSRADSAQAEAGKGSLSRHSSSASEYGEARRSGWLQGGYGGLLRVSRDATQPSMGSLSDTRYQSSRESLLVRC